MRKLIIILISFLAFCVEANCQGDYQVSAKIGIPKASNEERESFSFSIDASISKELLKNTLMGFGFGYTQNDQFGSMVSFTYDNKIISSYLHTTYKIQLIKKIIIAPELQAGYAFFESSLNEYNVDKKWDNGFLIGGGMNLFISLTKKLQLIPIISCFSILKKQTVNANLSIPTFFDTNPKYVIIRKIGIGFQIEL